MPTPAPTTKSAFASTPTTTAAEVRQALLEGSEIALIDVREEGLYAQAHPLFAANLPMSRLELDSYSRIPRRSTRIVVYADGDDSSALPTGGTSNVAGATGAVGTSRKQQASRAEPDRLHAAEDSEDELVKRALKCLWELGYTQVTALEGGLQGWRNSGGELFSGVNVPCKAFCELLDATRHDTAADHEHAPTTSFSADEVKEFMDGTAQTVILGPTSADPFQRSEDAAGSARAVAVAAGAVYASVRDVERMRADRARTTYLFDVRTEGEYEAGHLPGSRNVPHGQLVHKLDLYAPVRGARIVVIGTGSETDGVRASLTASWLAQMRVETYVLEGYGPETLSRTGRWRAPMPDLQETFGSFRPTAPVLPARLSGWLTSSTDTLVLDVGSSARFAKEHIPGSWFVLRSQLQRAVRVLPKPLHYVVTSDEDNFSSLAASDLASLTDAAVHVLQGGVDSWRRGGFAVQAGVDQMLSPPIDKYRRPHEGTHSRNEDAVLEMKAFLEWKKRLVDQLRRDGTHGFRIIT